MTKQGPSHLHMYLDMITRKFLRTTRFPRSVSTRFYSKSALSSRPSIVRSSAPISRFFASREARVYTTTFRGYSYHTFNNGPLET
jgi:hypothetical protein